MGDNYELSQLEDSFFLGTQNELVRMERRMIVRCIGTEPLTVIPIRKRMHRLAYGHDPVQRKVLERDGRETELDSPMPQDEFVLDAPVLPGQQGEIVDTVTPVTPRKMYFCNMRVDREIPLVVIRVYFTPGHRPASAAHGRTPLPDADVPPPPDAVLPGLGPKQPLTEDLLVVEFRDVVNERLALQWW